MSDEGPPDWFDNAPPPDAGSYGQQGAVRGGQRGKGGAPRLTAEQAAAAAEDFYAWLTARETRAQLELVLPDQVDPDIFVATAKTAVLNKPDLLRADLRPSLLLAVQKAAGQGLLPDGKQGALVPRYDTEAKQYGVVWQPMVWGIAKLGRETGAIRSIRAVIVFHGEPFRIVQGDEDRIEHEVVPDIVDEAYGALNAGKDGHGNPLARPAEFFARVRAAYCVITGSDGIPTKRWMTKQRLVSLWEASRAVNGPWNSRWIDEMICKALILFTSKWINLDPASATAKRFQAALMTDLEIDFDRERETLDAPPAHPPQAALPPPEAKLGTLEDLLGREKEKVPVGGEISQAGTQEAGGVRPLPASATTHETARDAAEDENAASASAAPAAQAAGDSAVSPAADPLAERVDAALGEITKRSAEAVAKMAGGKSYRAFVKELADAGRNDLTSLLASAVRQKSEQPTEAESVTLANIHAAESATALGEIERTSAFKTQVAALSPGARSRIHAAIAARYESLAPTGEDAAC